VDRIDELLQASLSRESLLIDQQRCTHCSENNSAKWRCIDCTLAKPICRRCMRHTHRNSPFHRIECWNGTHFRPAEQWEVGTYILVPHHAHIHICERLSFQMEYLEDSELLKDNAEQELSQAESSAPASAPASTQHHKNEYHSTTLLNSEMEIQVDWEDEIETDNSFSHMLDSIRQGQDVSIGVMNSIDLQDGDDEIGVNEADEDIRGFRPYLPGLDMNKADVMNAGAGADRISVPNDNVPMSDALNNTYVRVVHINGIHHLAMVTCHCQGDRQIPLDLVAANLLPASFIRIRTLFTAQLLNYFRLCNLELKASAYQFYQLIRRLTMPMSPAEVINLYHEFRRMSRLWRWMKKLKWAGYGHTHKDTKDPEPGSLANFCPACPQPNVNLANNWKDDENKCVPVNLPAL
jgi:hypothetical protein